MIQSEPRLMQMAPSQGFLGDVVDPGSDNADASRVYPAVDGAAHVLHEILVSYSGSGTLAGGNIEVLDGADVILSGNIVTMGMGVIPLLRPMQGTAGRSMTVTLAAGGANVRSQLAKIGHVLRFGIMPDIADWGYEDSGALMEAID